jgi:hypothetical protein
MGTADERQEKKRQETEEGRQGTETLDSGLRMGVKEQRRKIGDIGRETRQRRETGNIGH